MSFRCFRDAEMKTMSCDVRLVFVWLEMVIFTFLISVKMTVLP